MKEHNLTIVPPSAPALGIGPDCERCAAALALFERAAGDGLSKQNLALLLLAKHDEGDGGEVSQEWLRQAWITPPACLRPHIDRLKEWGLL